MQSVSPLGPLLVEIRPVEMSRRSRAGTAEKPPSVEETLGRLEVKLKELELKYELKEKEESQYRTSLQETIESLR